MGFLDKLFGSSGRGEADEKRAEYQKQMMDLLQEAGGEFDKIPLPVLEKLQLAVEYPELVGTLQAEQLGDSRLGDIETDPRLREAQMAALAELQTMSSEGMTPQQEEMFADLRERGRKELQAKDADIMASLARRGLVGGAGQAARTEALMKQQSSQSVANEEARQARKMAAEQAAAQRQATMQSGQLAGSMSAEDYKRAAAAEQARQAIEQFNLQNRQNVATRNLTEKQRIAEERARLKNQKGYTESMYNIQIPQQHWANQMALAGQKAGFKSGMANLAGQQAANVKPIASQGFAPVLGSLAGAAIGGLGSGGTPQGAMIGANIGGGLGQAGSSMYQNYEDGGIAGNFGPSEGNLKEVYSDNKKDKKEKSELSRLADLLKAVDKYANGGTVKAQEGLVVPGLDTTMRDEYVSSMNPKMGVDMDAVDKTTLPTTSPALDAKVLARKAAIDEAKAAEESFRNSPVRDPSVDLTPEERDALFDASDAAYEDEDLIESGVVDKDLEEGRSSLSNEDVANYAHMGSAILQSLAKAGKREVDDGYKAPVADPRMFAPMTPGVKSTIKIPGGSGLYKEGGIVGTDGNDVTGQHATPGNQWTSKGNIENMQTAAKGMGDYFENLAKHDYAEEQIQHNVNSLALQSLASTAFDPTKEKMFADGGIPKKGMSNEKLSRIIDSLNKIQKTNKQAMSGKTDLVDTLNLRKAAQLKDLAADTGEEIAQKVGRNPGQISDLLKKLESDKLKRFGKVTAKGLKSVPAVGLLAGLAAAGASGDVSAAVPVLGDVEAAGPKPGSPEARMESGERMSQEEFDALQAIIRKKAKAAGQKFAGGGCAKEYEAGGIPVEGYDSDVDEEVIDGTSYVGDRVDAKVNSGEMVLNLDQQQRLMELLRGERELEEMPMDEDVVRETDDEETNLHEKNEELEARLAALENMIKG